MLDTKSSAMQSQRMARYQANGAPARLRVDWKGKRARQRHVDDRRHRLAVQLRPQRARCCAQLVVGGVRDRECRLREALARDVARWLDGRTEVARDTLDEHD